MITEGILTLFFGAIDGLLGLIPSLSFVFDNGIFRLFFDIIKGGCYLLPMGTVATIISIIIAINLFKVGVALVKTILKFIPFF